jgi:hypothetical protein
MKNKVRELRMQKSLSLAGLAAFGLIFLLAGRSETIRG